MVALRLKEGAGARKHEATLESLLTHGETRPRLPRLKLYEKPSDSANIEEQVYAERIRGKEQMRTAITI